MVLPTANRNPCGAPGSPFNKACSASPTTAGRQRDIFPLPKFCMRDLPHVDPSVASRRSAKCRQRLGKRKGQFELFSDCVDSLNWLADGSFNSRTPVTCKATAAQMNCCERVLTAVAVFGPPPAEAVGPTEALRELRGSLDYDGDAAPRNLAPLDLSCLSLPAEGNQPVALSSLGFDGEHHKRVEEFCSTILLPMDYVPSRLLSAPKRVYSDPRLHQRKIYLQLVHKMLSS
jgi:hypothetical protein